MAALKNTKTYVVLAVLAGVMAATRYHHFGSALYLPDASWAVFFLAGVYLRLAWMFPVLCVLAGVIDWVAITWGGVSSFCVTPAYTMLLPAYGSLWLGGRWYARHHREVLATLVPLAGVVLVSAFAAEMFSSGGFYFLGGQFAATSLAEFLSRELRYFPPMLGAMAIYVGLAALVHAVLGTRTSGDAESPRSSTSGRNR